MVNLIKEKGSSDVGVVILAALFYLCVFSFGVFISGCAFDWTTEYWIQYFTGTFKNIPFWASCVAGVLLSGIVLPLWIVTLILSYVI